MKLNKLVLIFICILGLSACESQSEKDLKQAKSKRDIVMQLEALKLLEAQKNTDFHAEYLMVKEIISLNSASTTFQQEKNYRDAFISAAKANALRPNKQSRALLKHSGKKIVSEVAILNAIVPWYINGQVLLKEKYIALDQWRFAFVKPKEVPKSEILTLFAGDSEELALLTYEDARNMSKVLSTDQKSLPAGMHKAFFDVQAMMNLLISDRAFYQVSQAMKVAIKIQTELIDELQMTGRVTAQSGAWERDFLERSRKFKDGIDKDYLDMAVSSGGHVYNNEPSAYQLALKEMINSSKLTVQNMLWPENGDLGLYFENKEARELAVKKEYEHVAALSKTVKRKRLAINYLKAVKYLHIHYQKYKELQQPLNKYLNIIRGY
jgi:hypothetical protein